MLFERFARRGGASPTAIPTTPLYLGAEFRSGEVHIARYERRGDRVVLVHDAVARIESLDRDRQIAAVREAVRELRLPRTLLGRPTVVTPLAEDAAIVRRVPMQLAKGMKRERVARYQAANARVFNEWPIEDCIVKSRPVPGRDDVFVVGKALRDVVRSRISLLRAAGLNVRVEPRSFSLGRALPKAQAILDIGERESHLYVYSSVVGGVATPLAVPLARKITFGEVDITRAIMSALGVNYMEAEAFESEQGIEPALYLIQNLAMELSDNVAKLRDEENAEVGEIVIVGRVGRFDGVEAHLSRALHLPVSVAKLDDLGSDDLPMSVVHARGAELAPSLGAALLAEEKNDARRLNFAGTDSEALGAVSIDARRLRRAIVAPIAAVVIVAGAYVFEGMRVGDMQLQAVMAKHDMEAATKRAAQVNALHTNVETLLAVYTELQQIRASGAARAYELNQIDKALADVDVDSTTATANGWTIAGTARNHYEIGNVLTAVQHALPGIVSVVPPDSSRPQQQPNDPVKYTLRLTRATAPVSATTRVLPRPDAATPVAPSIGPTPAPTAEPTNPNLPHVPSAPSVPATMFAAGTLEMRRRVPLDRRLLNLSTFVIAGLGYIVIVYHGEEMFAQAQAQRDAYRAQERNALAAVELNKQLLATQAQLIGKIGNLTPQRDMTSLIASAYKELDMIARQHSHVVAGTLHVGASLDQIKINLTENPLAGRAAAATLAAQGRINSKGEATGPTSSTPTDATDALDATAFQTNGVADQYVSIVPAAVSYEGSVRDVLACLSDLSHAHVLAQVRTASLSRVQQHVTLRVDVGFYMPLAIDANGVLRPKLTPRSTNRTVTVTAAGANPPAASNADLTGGLVK